PDGPGGWAPCDPPPSAADRASAGPTGEAPHAPLASASDRATAGGWGPRPCDPPPSAADCATAGGWGPRPCDPPWSPASGRSALDAANVASWIQSVLRIELGLDGTHQTDAGAGAAPDVDRALEHRRAALDHQRRVLAECRDAAPQRSERFRFGRIARRVRHAAASMRPDQWLQSFELLFKRGYQSRGCRDRCGRLQHDVALARHQPHPRQVLPRARGGLDPLATVA